MYRIFEKACVTLFKIMNHFFQKNESLFWNREKPWITCCSRCSGLCRMHRTWLCLFVHKWQKDLPTQYAWVAGWMYSSLCVNRQGATACVDLNWSDKVSYVGPALCRGGMPNWLKPKSVNHLKRLIFVSGPPCNHQKVTVSVLPV